MSLERYLRRQARSWRTATMRRGIQIARLASVPMSVTEEFNRDFARQYRSRGSVRKTCREAESPTAVSVIRIGACQIAGTARRAGDEGVRLWLPVGKARWNQLSQLQRAQRLRKRRPPRSLCLQPYSFCRRDPTCSQDPNPSPASIPSPRGGTSPTPCFFRASPQVQGVRSRVPKPITRAC
jgi:hypothetical protein